MPIAPFKAKKIEDTDKKTSGTSNYDSYSKKASVEPLTLE
jgi:hypothetical protein